MNLFFVNVEKLRRLKFRKIKFKIELIGEEGDKGKRRRHYQSDIGDRVIDLIIVSEAYDFISVENDLNLLQDLMIERYA